MATSFNFAQWVKQKPIIGMVHLLPLPGSPLFAGSVDEIIERAVSDAELLAQGGCHGLMMENFGDSPFAKGRVEAQVISIMTRIATEIKKRVSCPLGINVLRNDGLSALAVALASNADFIRVNILTGARVTDQGIIEGIAYELLRARQQLGASHIKILTDVDVKHSAALAPRPLVDEVKDTLSRGGADALIVSGSGTGAAVDPAKVQLVKSVKKDSIVLLGSGVTKENLPSLAKFADGFIVGTSLKVNGVSTNPVDIKHVKELIAVHSALPKTVV